MNNKMLWFWAIWDGMFCVLYLVTFLATGSLFALMMVVLFGALGVYQLYSIDKANQLRALRAKYEEAAKRWDGR